MIWPIEITSLEEYRIFEKFKFNPLISDIHFRIDIHTRKEIILAIFGYSCPANDVKFYRWMWDHKPHVCEEFMIPLWEYSAGHISHILTRGAHTEMRYDPRNINILSAKAHRTWETGIESEKKKMNIWDENQLKIKILKDEYSKI